METIPDAHGAERPLTLMLRAILEVPRRLLFTLWSGTRWSRPVRVVRSSGVGLASRYAPHRQTVCAWIVVEQRVFPHYRGGPAAALD